MSNPPPSPPCSSPPYWFQAKKYGWGWSRATTWQGWVTLGAFFTLLAIGALWVLPHLGPVVFLLYTTVLAAGLLAICLKKGEPAKWRWGSKQPLPHKQPPTPPV